MRLFGPHQCAILKRQSKILAKQRPHCRTPYYMQLELPILAQLSRIIAAKILPNLRLFAGSGCYDCFKTHTCKDSNKHYTCMQMYAWICVAIIRQGAVTSLRISGSSSDTPVQEMRQLVENHGKSLSSWEIMLQHFQR